MKPGIYWVVLGWYSRYVKAWALPIGRPVLHYTRATARSMQREYRQRYTLMKTRVKKVVI